MDLIGSILYRWRIAAYETTLMNETGTFEVQATLGGKTNITQGEFYGYLLKVGGILPWWKRVQLWLMFTQEPWRTVVRTEREDWRAAIASVGGYWSFTIAFSVKDRSKLISDRDFLNYFFGNRGDVSFLKRLRMRFEPWASLLTSEQWAMTYSHFDVFSKEELVESLLWRIQRNS